MKYFMNSRLLKHVIYVTLKVELGVVVSCEATLNIETA
jgi:hypothetical protein